MRKEITEEVDMMRAEIERLNKDLLAKNACCDGASAQDAHVRQEREEHRAEVEKLRREIKNLREAMQSLAERLEVDPSGTDKIDDLEAENERLRADLLTQQGCCDGAAAQDAHVRQERKERRAEIKNLRASNKRMRELLSAIQIDTNADGSVWLTLSPSAYPGFIAVVYLGSQKLMAGTAALLFDELRRKALEGKP